MNFSELRSQLSEEARILDDPASQVYHTRLERWTNIDKARPSAIIVCCNEADCTYTVQWCIKTATPFTPCCGGNSSWATIGSQGVVVDLRDYTGVDVDLGTSTAIVKGGSSTKDVATELARHNRCTALGNGNAIGAIPYFLNGGNSPLNSLVGCGSDQIISARMITADGRLIEANEASNASLLWALRGAGQFFGLVTELRIRIYPFSVLGEEEGSIWSGTFAFRLEQLMDVSTVMSEVMDNQEYHTGGLIMVTTSPFTQTPILMVSAKLIGSLRDPDVVFKGLYELKPVMVKAADIPIQNMADSVDPLMARGDYKKLTLVGAPEPDMTRFAKTVELWKELTERCPDAKRTSFSFQWQSRSTIKPSFDSANCNHDIRFWQNNMTWHVDPANRRLVEEYDTKALTIMRGTADQRHWIDFQNSTRTGPIEARYRGAGRLARLMSLKRQWDPHGLFTRQLL
ncbi:MAG: hypothetical protein M1828_007138 [Chrysothrix sp. TS-e1954]|nr:MAG: hypothetical protein M1828_007138 [Chrysothrix sp. TS-e1954]